MNAGRPFRCSSLVKRISPFEAVKAGVVFIRSLDCTPVLAIARTGAALGMTEARMFICCGQILHCAQNDSDEYPISTARCPVESKECRISK